MFANEGVYWIRNKSLSTRLVDVRNNPYVHGGERTAVPIGLLSPSLARTQLWLVEEVRNANGEFFVLRNYATGTVLDVQDGSSTEGSAIVVQPYKSTGDASSQHWKIDFISDDDKTSYYLVTNQKTGTVLDQTDNSKNGDDFSIESSNRNDGDRQLWSFEEATFPTMYWLLNLPSNRCLEYKPSSTDVVTMEIKSDVASRSQLWYLESVLDDIVYSRIRHVDHEDRVLDLSDADNKSILALADHGADNQKWKMTDANENGTINIVCGQNDAVLYGEADQEGRFHARASPDGNSFEGHSDWLLIPCHIPPLFWTTVESTNSGMLMAQSGDSVIAVTPDEAEDTAQWRFVNQGREPRFAIIARQTGGGLRDSSGNLTITDNNSDQYQWALDSDGRTDGYRITNLNTLNLISYMNDGKIASVYAGASNDQQWLINEANNSRLFPSVSFAAGKILVPGRVTWAANPRLTPAPAFIQQVFSNLIRQMDFDEFTDARARQLAGTSRNEVENVWHLTIPPGLRAGSERPGWCRIDCQGPGTGEDAGRANIQGQWNGASVFHLLIQLNQMFGTRLIRNTMLESIRRTQTARLVRA